MPESTPRLDGMERPRRPQIAPPAYLTPGSIAAVRELAELIAAGEWAPASYRGGDGHYMIEKIVLGIMHGAAVGLGPFAAVHAIAVIDGQPTIWGDGALALVERSGLIEDMREDYTVDGEDGLTAICTMRRRPWPTPIARRFSMAMAEEAGLTQKEGPWQTYPRRMLMMRARSWALRDGFADVLRGLSIREEVADYDNVATPPPEPVFADRSVAPLRHPIMRPRFTDYPSSHATAGTTRPRRYISGDCRKGALVADPGHPRAGAGSVNEDPIESLPAATAEPSAESVDAPPSAAHTEPLGAIEESHAGETSAGRLDGRITSRTIEQDHQGMAPPEISPNTDGRSANEISASAGYGLIDAEGGFIEVDGLEALREAFERLFADPQLSAAQVLGVWESNKGAHDELERAFGIAAITGADRRRQCAEREEGYSSEHAKANRPIPAAVSSRRRTTKPKDVLEDACNQLELDASCSDEKLLQLYRSRLLRLKRRRAKAATFIDFRQANRAIEERLRENLPHLIAGIDMLYVWAALRAG
jgi:hypothetical protein